MVDDANHDKLVELNKRLSLIEQQFSDALSKNLSLQYMNSQFQSQAPDEIIDLRAVWLGILQGKLVIVALTLLFGVTSFIYSFTLSDSYRSEVLLAPAEDNSGGGIAGLAGQLGGLAGLAGISVGAQGSKTLTAVEVMKSRSYIIRFLKKHDLVLPMLYAYGWDEASKSLLYRNDYEVRLNGQRGEIEYSDEELYLAYEQFLEVLSVELDNETGFVRIGALFYSPEIAQSIASDYVTDINLEMREREMTEAKRSIGYLNKQLEKTSITGFQKVFYDLIEEQTKIVMFSEIKKEYPFVIIDKAYKPVVPSYPNRILIVGVGVLLGGALGFAYAIMRFLIARPSHK